MRGRKMEKDRSLRQWIIPFFRHFFLFRSFHLETKEEERIFFRGRGARGPTRGLTRSSCMFDRFVRSFDRVTDRVTRLAVARSDPRVDP